MRENILPHGILFVGLFSCQSEQQEDKQIPTIDSALQVKVTSILEDKLIELNTLSRQTIIIEVQTGHIKAIVRLERKDSVDYQSRGNFSRTHKSALIQPMSILAALEIGKVGLSDIVDVSNGIYSVQGRELKDRNWYRSGYGKISIKQGSASSSNIAVYKTVGKAFRDDTQAYFNLIDGMSYGRPSCIAGIASLKPAYFVTPKDSSWSDAALVWFCIGYNQTITPIQTLTFYNAIANSGKMAQPQLYKGGIAVINLRIANRANTDSLKQALEYVVIGGLGQPAESNKVQVAGETGTIQFEDGSCVVEFYSYFPINAPQCSIIVSIRKERLSVSGGLIVGDVFRQIIEYIIAYNKYFDSK